MPGHHIETEYLNINKQLCTACGECVEVCPDQVLKVVGFNFIIKHQHVKVVQPENCTGCLSCVAACPEGAIQAL
jgi:ferredoxin